MTGSARSQMLSLNRSNNVKRPFSEIRLRKIEKIGCMETFRVIVRRSPPSSPPSFIQGMEGIKGVSTIRIYSMFYVSFVHDITS